ncbi:conserved hypothetical protein [Vibrio cholerae MO10]|uniref:Uncharacterized protein n=1 Tax=Vibrio cholerae (strain MO10) TaxID=345072 RepID=A0A0X1L0L6_VIBCO|nr:conserved hypothetical protein [Vibrio cholerae MO10]EJH30289.1 hypothetical protein VCCP10325_2022 [Vibrio cholerae CP1032(5)]EMQ56093.1 hypothetical protein VCNHCC004A_001783 [Vibrio cholerae O1 str. NHCC-004A]KKP14523.1 hypothetical protein VS84_00864 [Vibrio cholerae]KKP21184.1 hypothetical protein VS86_00744 [Vibrio cholerae]
MSTKAQFVALIHFNPYREACLQVRCHMQRINPLLNYGHY